MKLKLYFTVVEDENSYNKGGSKKTIREMENEENEVHGAIVKLCQKEGSRPFLDLTITAQMEEKTEVFKRVAIEAKDRQWKCFWDTLNRDTTLTHFW